MNFEDEIKCDRLTLGKNWLQFPGEDNIHSAAPDQITGAIIRLENYNGTMLTLSFRSGALIKVVQNTLHYNREDVVDCL